MKTTILITVVTLTGVLFSGCSNQELMMAQSLANNNAVTQGTASYFSGALNQAGVVQGQAVGVSTFANPMALSTIAVTGALSAKRVEENKKAFVALDHKMQNQDYANDTVKAYNKKHGTSYKSMQELQNAQSL